MPSRIGKGPAIPHGEVLPRMPKHHERVTGQVEEVDVVVDDEGARGLPLDLPTDQLSDRHPLVGVEVGRGLVE